MIKGIIKKAVVVSSLMVVAGGIAFAAFSITQTASNGNKVTSASAGLLVTSSPFNLEGLLQGGSTPNNPLTIKNTGVYAGDVKLNIANPGGGLCPDLTLTVSGDASGSTPIAVGSMDLGNLAPGATLNLVQVVTMKNPSSLLEIGRASCRERV